MKKLSLLLFIVMALSLTLSSCHVIWRVVEPKDEVALYKRIDKMMDKADSYRASLDGKIAFEYEGVRVEGTLDGTNIIIGSPEDEDFYFYIENRLDMTVGGTAQSIGVYESIAYDGEKMYTCSGEDGRQSYLCSDLGAEEFYEFISGNDIDLELSPELGGKREMKKLDEGGWELSFSELSDGDLEDVLEQLSLDVVRDQMDVRVDDISVLIRTDEYFRVDNMLLDFSSDGVDEPVISLKITYSGYGTVQEKQIDKEEYTEVPDARIAKWIDSSLNEAMSAERTKFTLYTRHSATVKAGYQQHSNSSVETGRITFYNKDGEFEYSVEADVEGVVTKIEYEDGIQTVTGKNLSQQTEQSEAEARAFIMSLLNCSGYTPAAVESMTEIGEGVYRISLDVSRTSEYRQLMQSAGFSYSGNSGLNIEVTMDGEDVISIRSLVVINGSKNIGSSNTYTCEYTIEQNMRFITEE